VTGAPNVVTVHITGATNLAPAYSADGVTWTFLKPGQYSIEPTGDIDIQTTVPGYFAVLPDTTPPSRPDGFTGRFVSGSLRLAWNASTDNVQVASYNVLLDGGALQSVPAKTRRAIVRSFHPTTQTVYRVQSVDPTGNVSVPSKPIVVVPTKRPADVPRALPRWAWGLYDAQHGRGVRPAATPKKLPKWYWHWAAWRSAPFHLKR